MPDGIAGTIKVNFHLLKGLNMYYTVTIKNLLGIKSTVFTSLELAVKWAASFKTAELYKHVLNIASNKYDRFDMSDLLN